MSVDGDCIDILVFKLAGRRGGLLLEDVLEVVRAVAITPLPRAPDVIEGIINVRGEVVPVIDLRTRFGLAKRKVALSDRFIIVRAGRRTIAMRADEAATIMSVAKSAIENVTRAVGDGEGLVGVARLQDGLALIYDVNSFLSSAHSDELDRALSKSEDA